MYQTFNMGIGMEIIVKSKSEAFRVIEHAGRYNISAAVTGYTTTSKDGRNHVVIDGKYTYTK